MSIYVYRADKKTITGKLQRKFFFLLLLYGEPANYISPLDENEKLHVTMILNGSREYGELV